MSHANEQTPRNQIWPWTGSGNDVAEPRKHQSAALWQVLIRRVMAADPIDFLSPRQLKNTHLL